MRKRKAEDAALYHGLKCREQRNPQEVPTQNEVSIMEEITLAPLAQSAEIKT